MCPSTQHKACEHKWLVGGNNNGTGDIRGRKVLSHRLFLFFHASSSLRVCIKKIINYADKACHATQVSSIVIFDAWSISDRDESTAPSKGGVTKVTEKS